MGSGLVKQHDIRLGRQAPGDRNALPFATRQPIDPAQAKMSEIAHAMADSIADRSRSRSRSNRPRCGCRPIATISSTVKREIASGVLWQERQAACDVRRGIGPIGQTAERDRAARDGPQPRKHPQQCALAAPVRPDDRCKRPRRTATRRTSRIARSPASPKHPAPRRPHSLGPLPQVSEQQHQEEGRAAERRHRRRDESPPADARSAPRDRTR